MENNTSHSRKSKKISASLFGSTARDNKYLNRILWLLVAAGPLIAVGITAETFKIISYSECGLITVVTFAVALIHYLTLKKDPDNPYVGILALAVINVLIAYLGYVNVPLTLIWFLVPLLSIFLCNRGIYLMMSLFNYVLMVGTTWFAAERDLELARSFHAITAYFVDKLGAYSLQALIMFAAGLLLINLVEAHYKELVREKEAVKFQEGENREKLSILDSMAEIYDHVNLIDFVAKTEMSLRDRQHVRYLIDMPRQTHTRMNQRIRPNVMTDQLDQFWEFTNITTVPERLTQKKIISADFVDVVSGWFRAQYITVEATPDGVPTVVIYTIRNVDEEKRREEHLIRVAMTDELTRLFNRRSYEEDLTELRSKPLPKDFVIFSFDVNGLKTVNDNLGHDAGDELIKGAADCLLLAVGIKGKVYRTGGDEFIAILHTDDPEAIRADVEHGAETWRGEYSDTLSISVGYAALTDHPDKTVDELERLSDAEMYAAKGEYYRQKGIDRRRR